MTKLFNIYKTQEIIIRDLFKDILVDMENGLDFEAGMLFQQLISYSLYPFFQKGLITEDEYKRLLHCKEYYINCINSVR